MDLITVIVPVYKVEKYLYKCVDSILAQTYTNLEIILVDDGSPDNCGKICDEYAAKDSRVKVIHQENGGLSAARNAGLDIATGEYIGFVDSDDYIAPEMYEKLYDAINKNNADLAICNYKFVDESGKPLKKEMPIKNRVLTGEQALEMLQIKHYGCFVSSCNRLFKSNVIKDIHFPEGKINEDNLTAHEIIYKCQKVVLIKDALYFYLQRPGSIMHRPVSIDRFADVDAVVNKIEFYSSHDLDRFILPSKKQLLRIYRYLRINYKSIPEKEMPKVIEYDVIAKNIYDSIKRDCTWKDYLFFHNRFLYKLFFDIKHFFRGRE